ncbi:hemerythrin domain-containing protein [Qipengyuania qiaonensis]|uniref:Hemerythrin domain-containing protein n=1 Tax=Qipengyuania qiaonensis TaxID=2867240 RepID=A0ABS7J8P2_9SPHN|nr:hemerythrin domain-containing protein [Qipengyuania qiaonensis]MBX7483683.1 hemerythrin domain-containing protein [Qipengyuania qiaonensis]
MDIVDCILADHDQQRRMFSALDEARGDKQALDRIFTRLKHFLEAHAEAEELYFYPTLLKLGEGALDSDSSEDTTEDAIGDHNKIAEAGEAAGEHEPGSDEWWKCVDQCNLQNSKHMSEEERQGLTDFRRHVPIEERIKLGIQYLGFEAKHSADYERKEKDPETYIEENA